VIGSVSSGIPAESLSSRHWLMWDRW
jgi:hypothetical protein